MQRLRALRPPLPKNTFSAVTRRWASDDGDKPYFGGRLRTLIRFAGFSAALLVGTGGTIIFSWPLIDAKVLPWCYKRSFLTASAETVPKVKYNHEAAVIDELKSLFDDDDQGQIVVVSGRALSGKTSLIGTLTDQQEGDPHRPIAYVSWRAVTGPAVALYAHLSTLLIPTLGKVGQVVVAYHKLFNALSEMLTMCQEHKHVAFIIYCQVMQHLRVAMYEMKEQRDAEVRDGKPVTARKPILVVDSSEGAVDMIRQSGGDPEIAEFAHLYFNLALRSCIDENLCHVLILTDSDALSSDVSAASRPTASSGSKRKGRRGRSTPEDDGDNGDSSGSGNVSFQSAFPDVARRAKWRYLQPQWQEADVSEWDQALRDALQGPDVRPYLAAEFLAKASTDGAVKICEFAEQFEQSRQDVCDAAETLCDHGLLSLAMGSQLGAANSTTGKKRTSGVSLRMADPTAVYVAPKIRNPDLIRDAATLDVNVSYNDGLLYSRLMPRMRSYSRFKWYMWRSGFVSWKYKDSDGQVIEDYSSLMQLQNGSEIQSVGFPWLRYLFGVGAGIGIQFAFLYNR